MPRISGVAGRRPAAALFCGLARVALHPLPGPHNSLAEYSRFELFDSQWASAPVAGASIGIRYPLVEIATAILTVLVAMKFWYRLDRTGRHAVDLVVDCPDRY